MTEATIFRHTDNDGDWLTVTKATTPNIIVIAAGNASNTSQIVFTHEEASSLACCLLDTINDSDIRNSMTNAEAL